GLRAARHASPHARLPSTGGGRRPRGRLAAGAGSAAHAPPQALSRHVGHFGVGLASFIACLPCRALAAAAGRRARSNARLKSNLHRCRTMVERFSQSSAMTTTASLIEELECALAAGSNAQRIAMLSRVTDLFVEGASRYSVGQINLFDEVIAKLIAVIEAKARAKLSSRLAPMRHAPPGVIRLLAFDDDIAGARPALIASEPLDDADLLANASSKSQQHLAAIARRKSLSEPVTEVLVARGDRQVVQTVARNTGARFSDAGFRMLVRRSIGDDALAMQIGAR